MAFSIFPKTGEIEDIAILEDSGNIYVNRVYEAKLTEDDFAKNIVVSDNDEEEKRRGKFIKHKYKKQKYFDEVVYHKQVLEVLQKKHEQRRLRAAQEGRQSHRGRESGSEDDDTTSPLSESSRNSVDSENRRSAGDRLKDSRAKMRGSLVSTGCVRGDRSDSSLKGNRSFNGESEPRSRSRRGMMGKAHSMRNLSSMATGRDKHRSVPGRTFSSGGGLHAKSGSSGSLHARSSHSRSGKRDSSTRSARSMSIGDASVESASSKQFKPNHTWASKGGPGEGKGKETRQFKPNPYAA